MRHDLTDKIINSRKSLFPLESDNYVKRKDDEGGCGVIGIISTLPVKGKNIIKPCAQMRNRGNGKGGGIAAAGIFPKYKDLFAIQIAYIDIDCRKELERKYLLDNFDITEIEEQKTIEDHRDVGLELKPPHVARYFSKVKESVLEKFMNDTGISDSQKAEEEFIYQNSFKLNREFYGGSNVRAFVLSHARDLMILKGVGYAEEICKYYCLDDVKANIWIGHQRYPTRGRVWHPGGAHPFTGMNEALVHNGDFANYYAVTEYLTQKNIYPLFITDTEVSVLLFDLYTRVYDYPLEYTIEALAPTSERDFDMLPKVKQRIYRAIKNSHIHGSPDGPWFFIIARSESKTGNLQLIGITDTSMLRPQVFTYIDTEDIKIGAIASEKQAVDAFLDELSLDYPKICHVADKYWNARGGSHTDGGAFIYNLEETVMGKNMIVTDKFGNRIASEKKKSIDYPSQITIESHTKEKLEYRKVIDESFDSQPSSMTYNKFIELLKLIEPHEIIDFVAYLINKGKESHKIYETVRLLTFLCNRRYPIMNLKRGLILDELNKGINASLRSVPTIDQSNKSLLKKIDFHNRKNIRKPQSDEKYLVIRCGDFPAEGSECVARLIVSAYELGWKDFVLFECIGDRFIGSGLGADSTGVRIDVYGSSGDYLGSGLDGAEIYVHGNAQDQVGQILKSGKIVIFGDVGQTFLYGAKGGSAYVMGNTAGRPLINSVGRVRAIINGTCLDYCAESFMAGASLDGGFVIINGLEFDERGEIIGLETKYPGSNFFSLASGGAGYISDPYYTMSKEQLNGGKFIDFTHDDWQVIHPYLIENEKLFGIQIRRDLLTVDGVIMWPKEVFRKVVSSDIVEDFDWSSLPA
jgi:glutamate synthase domain-containing protein 1/glutamate synthase domain-containing protein 3